MTTQETGKLTIHNMVDSGPYHTKHSYTKDQQEEIRELMLLAARASVRELRPDLANHYEISEIQYEDARR